MSAPGARPGEPIRLPAPTAWPMLAAAGLCLALAGLVTHEFVAAAGAVLLLRSLAGWLGEVVPVEREVDVERPHGAGAARRVSPSTRGVEHLVAGEAGHRMRLPVEVHPWSAGLRAGLVGGVVMALLAVGFGLVAHGSAWYPVNLLAASAMPSLAGASQGMLSAFDPTALAVATAIHLPTALLVGVLYALLLPMAPRHPVLAGGFAAPVVWTALLWAGFGVVNPELNERIEWRWFVASQIGFGLVAGWVISRTERIGTMQGLPLAARAGLEAPGLDDGRDER